MLRTLLLILTLSLSYASAKKVKKEEVPPTGRRRLTTGDITCSGANDLTVNYHTGNYPPEKSWRVVVEGYTVDGVVQGVCLTGGDSGPDVEDWTTKLESEGCAAGKSWHPYTSMHTVLEESQCIDMTPYTVFTAVKIIGWDQYSDTWDGGFITLVYQGVTSDPRYDGPPDDTKRNTWTFVNIVLPNPECPTNPLGFFKYTGSSSVSADADGCIDECPLVDGDSTKRQGRSGSGTSDDCAGVECVDASQFIYTVTDTCISACPLVDGDSTKTQTRSGSGSSDDCAGGVECVDASLFLYTGTQDPSKTDTCISECPASSNAAIVSFVDPNPNRISDACTVGAVQTCTDTSHGAGTFCKYDDDALGKEYFVIRKHPTNNCAIEPTNGEVDLSGLDTEGKPMYIAYEAFRDCTTLTSIILHPSTEVIGFYSFACYSWSYSGDEIYNGLLTSLTIPDSVTNIGIAAFYGHQIASLTIGNSVTNIGNYAFQGNALTSLTIPDSVTVIGSQTFQSNQIASLTIGNSVTTIGSYAFGSNDLTSLTIPDSVETIQAVAFGYNKITEVTIPDSVTSVGSNVFHSNPDVNVTLPNGNLIDIFDFYSSLAGSDSDWSGSGTIKGCQALSDAVTEDICPLGCTDSNYAEYNASAVLDDGSCATLSVSGGGIDSTDCAALKNAYQTQSCC